MSIAYFIGYFCILVCIMDQSFPRKEKLKSQKIIDQLFSDGQTITAFPLRLIFLKINGDNQVGVSVSKRNFKKAVDRNYIRRLMRESYRLNKTLLTDNNVNGYAFMILYISKDLPDFNLINHKMKKLFVKLSNKPS